MRRAQMIYCDCGTPILRERRVRIKDENEYGLHAVLMGITPDKPITTEQFYEYHRWCPAFMLPDGWYDVPEKSVTECPACHAALSKEIAGVSPPV